MPATGVPKRPSHLIGFDDAPFAARHRGDVLVVGAVFTGLRLEGVLSTRVRRDGRNATDRIAGAVARSRFAAHLQCLLVQGIALAGFNVIDLWDLHRRLGVPVLAVARRQPGFGAIRRALLDHVPGGGRKWRLIERLGAMEPAGRVFIQRAGIDLPMARHLVVETAVNGALPEPLRTAHLIAGGIATGESRHRA